MSDNKVIFQSENGMVFDSGDSFVGDDDAFSDDLAREVARLKVFELESEWISVNDEMPKIGEHVLVLIPTKYGSPPIDVAMCHNDGRQRPAWSEGWNKGERWEITHWRRISVPPKKRDNQ